MKVSQREPKKELRIYKPDEADQYYEFYVLVPQKIGSVTRAGHQRLVTDDGLQFTNLYAASRHALERSGEEGLADNQPMYHKSEARRVSVKGFDLVGKNIWHKFCEMRDLKPNDPQAISATYHISVRELNQLGAEDLAK